MGDGHGHREQQLRREVRHEREAKSLASILEVLDDSSSLITMKVLRISIRVATQSRGDTLVTFIVQDSEGDKWVGFHAADSPFRALAGGLQKLVKDEMKWRADEYS